jgi:hypothetical protein
MDSEVDYEVQPANNQCSSVINTETVKSNPNTLNTNTMSTINNSNSQAYVDSQYDNVNSNDVKPMYGGSDKIYKIIFKNNIHYIFSKSENKAIKKIIKNNSSKKDNLLEIFENNNSSMYIVKKNNSIKKIH